MDRSTTRRAVLDVTPDRSGLLGTSQTVGGPPGVAVVASLAAYRTEAELSSTNLPVTLDVTREALLSGFGLGFIVTSALAATTLVVAVATAPRRPRGGDA